MTSNTKCNCQALRNVFFDEKGLYCDNCGGSLTREDLVK